MIKLKSIHIEEMRGIRKLDLDFQEKNFVISGPNGCGKSGVIDAIEFALTGQIGRLTGRGTKGLSVSEHGPHVDKTKFPDAAFVELRVSLPRIGKSVMIRRKISAPKKPTIEPSDDDIKEVLAEIADHPEIALSRREILRFVIVEPSQRSEEIQALLKLDEIGQTRSALNTAQNKLQTTHRTAAAQEQASRDALQRHLQIPTLRQEDLLLAVNTRRKLLNLQEITELTADTKLDAGLDRAEPTEFNKDAAIRDLKALADAVQTFPTLAQTEVDAIVADLEKIADDPTVLVALQRRWFIEQGLGLVDGPECPLCDSDWESASRLREHLKAKLARSDEAKKLRDSVLKSGTMIAENVMRIVGLLVPVQRLAERKRELEFTRIVSLWKTDLEALAVKVTAIEGLATLKGRLEDDWLQTPKDFSKSLETFTGLIEAQPNQTAALDAQTFLTNAQLRLSDYRESRRKTKAAEIAGTAAKAAYGTYCDVLEDELNTLYDDVQEDFSKFYRAINEEDEAKFTAKLTPTEGKLDFSVNFYDRGLFPPGAYHSEGHQDGMGVCLYLALMKRLFGDRFSLALLDDVVMSVDTGHRYQFCKLLKTYFADTQFIITTHDRLWAEQMRSAGLVTSKASVAFHTWTVDGGPLVESNQEIWDEIAASLEKGKVEAAAASLRHHLEYVSRHLADELGAAPQFRADGNYELGELLPSVLARMKHLLGKAADAAQSWGKDAEKEAALERKATLSTCSGAINIEQWAVNKAVHYNEWANFGKKDFQPVVAAFKELLECFRCDSCESWLYVTPPRGTPESVRCPCNAISLNLKPKPREA